MAASQMGKLYLGSGTVITNTPLIINDPAIRMNGGDHLGGTMIISDQSYIITNTNIDGTFTLTVPIGTVHSVSLEPGKIYNYSFTDMDRSTLVNAINTALLSMGEHTTFTDLEVTATQHREFILPIGIQAPLKIEYFNYVSDGFVFSATNNWELTVKDGQNVITFQNRIVPNETAKIRVWYNSPHERLLADDDEINPEYHTTRLVYEAAYWGYFQFLAKEQNSSDRDLLLYQSILQERTILANRYPVPRILHKLTFPRN